jgi:hypothetical protein
LARLAGVTFAWGPKDAVAALTRKLAAPILVDPNLTPLERWLRAGERGLSSDAIVGHLRGWSLVDQRPNRPPPEDPPYPHDPGDFRRCLLLLEQVPELRESFTLFMPSASPTWELLVSTWDQLTELFLSEAPTDWRDPRSEGMAPKTRAALMRVVGLVGRVRP